MHYNNRDTENHAQVIQSTRSNPQTPLLASSPFPRHWIVLFLPPQVVDTGVPALAWPPNLPVLFKPEDPVHEHHLWSEASTMVPEHVHDVSRPSDTNFIRYCTTCTVHHRAVMGNTSTIPTNVTLIHCDVPQSILRQPHAHRRSNPRSPSLRHVFSGLPPLHCPPTPFSPARRHRRLPALSSSHPLPLPTHPCLIQAPSSPPPPPMDGCPGTSSAPLLPPLLPPPLLCSASSSRASRDGVRCCWCCCCCCCCIGDVFRTRRRTRPDAGDPGGRA